MLVFQCEYDFYQSAKRVAKESQKKTYPSPSIQQNQPSKYSVIQAAQLYPLLISTNNTTHHAWRQSYSLSGYINLCMWVFEI